MSLFCQLAMGTPFFFIPNKYRKGPSQREPADLVWACNGCIVLIYLCRLATSSKSIEHNLRQAKGWLRAWRNLGQALRGRNPYGAFSLSAIDAEYPHVVVLSIIECADAIAEYHRDEVKALDVTMCATVPLSAIANLTRMHASMLNVLYILDWMRVRHTEPISEADMMSGIADYHWASWRASNADVQWPADEADPSLTADHRMIDDFLHTMSSLPLQQLASYQGGVHNLDDQKLALQHMADSLPTARLFSDLILAEALALGLCIKRCVEACQARTADPTRPPNTAPFILNHVPLKHYDITLSAIDGDRPPNGVRSAEAVMKFSREHDRSGTQRVGPLIALLTQKQSPMFGGAMVAIGPQPRPSATELFLDRVRSEQQP